MEPCALQESRISSRAINDYVRINSQQPTSFIWTASVESIMVKINRCKAIYETLH